MNATLTAESPEVECWNRAVAELNAATALLVRDRPSSSARRAEELADRVSVARQEFNSAFTALQAVL